VKNPPAVPEKNAARIAGMFDGIAARYDLLNRVLSAGCDRGWRRRAVAALGPAACGTVLDVCTGTADLALAARTQKMATRVIGIDFSMGMLRNATAKIRSGAFSSSIHLVRGDATHLPVRDGAVDAVTVAFGIRNVEDPVAAFREFRRVLRVRGRLVVLEFSAPRGFGLRQVYTWYFRRVLPLIGRAVSGHPSAYSYLPASVDTFAGPGQLADRCRSAGFSEVETVQLSFGIVYILTAVKSAANSSSA
jgi:demethylmenaquinone methyltransferase / 2-methoxy-6-polyprenyl-1,4-benzoquinol methylase